MAALGHFGTKMTKYCDSTTANTCKTVAYIEGGLSQMKTHIVACLLNTPYWLSGNNGRGASNAKRSHYHPSK